MDIDKIIGKIIYLLHICILLFLIILILISNNKRILFFVLFIFIIVYISWILFNTCIIKSIEYIFLKNKEKKYNYLYFLLYFNIKDDKQKKIIMICQLFFIFICMIKIYNKYKIE